MEILAKLESALKSVEHKLQHKVESVEDMLEARGKQYGEFCSHAAITQRLKATFQSTANWSKLNDSQKEALEMVAHKIGRILNGDPNVIDSWKDIAGYVQLVVKELEANVVPVPVQPPTVATLTTVTVADGVGPLDASNASNASNAVQPSQVSL